ncbi:hypothetical protein EBBID32_40360 [Sphingobium indicum BiD32]|uniref:Uncharacterized protein n=1 Tax=Sphingobium indicum BiD32 TaxID=1301087 RepID=N1MVS9_9SPHN|nr:hypothetical protein EBBID32_40360 [Sphingobium indicum BiD32]
MLLPLDRGDLFRDLANRSLPLRLARGQDRQAVPQQRIRAIARIGIKAGVGQYNDRGLQPLGPMHRQQPQHVALRRGIADYVDFAPVEPVDEALERGMVVTLERQRGVEQFLDRIDRFRPQSLDQAATAIHRAGQDRLQIAIGRREIRHRQQIMKGFECRIVQCLFQMLPKPGLAPDQPVHQLVLGPSNQRGNQQRCHVQLIVGLHRKAQRGEQIAHRQRRVEPQPVDPGDRHLLLIEPRHDQPRQFAAATDQDHDVACPHRPPPAFEHHTVVDPLFDLLRDFLRQHPLLIGDPILLALGILGQVGYDRFPQLHFAGMPVGADMMDVARLQPQPLGAQGRNGAVHHVQHRRGRPETAVER